jgi:hypothetical protein
MGAALSVLFTLAGIGQAQPEADNAKLVKAWLAVCKSHADAYVISSAANLEEKFKMLPDPIFRHTQPVRGDDIGAVWLWVREDGRPGAVGTVFAYSGGAGGGGNRIVAHEFHSLLDQPLLALWRGNKQWAATKPGLEWSPIPGSPAPADSPARRARQMTALSGQFQAHEINFQGDRWELRLVAKPVYRYELKKTDAALDGAMFVFCQGTDPEVFLLIEARPTAEGPRWFCACAAFSDYELHVRHRDAEVWAPARGTPNDRQAPHWWYGYIERTRLPDEAAPKP